MVVPSHFLAFTPFLSSDDNRDGFLTIIIIMSKVVSPKKLKIMSTGPIFMTQYFATKVKNYWKNEDKKKPKIRPIPFLSKLSSLKIAKRRKNCILLGEIQVVFTETEVGFEGWMGFLKAKKEGSFILWNSYYGVANVLGLCAWGQRVTADDV